MEQNKIGYKKSWPYCIKCGSVIHRNGQALSREAYEGLHGICNECFCEGGGAIKNEKN